MPYNNYNIRLRLCRINLAIAWSIRYSLSLIFPCMTSLSVSKQLISDQDQSYQDNIVSAENHELCITEVKAYLARLSYLPRYNSTMSVYMLLQLLPLSLPVSYPSGGQQIHMYTVHQGFFKCDLNIRQWCKSELHSATLGGAQQQKIPILV